MSYGDTISYLYGLQPVGIKLGLDNIRTVLERLKNPHMGFRSIHIAGTNGKGSTAAMTASFLEAAGLRTGLFTSPHLLSFTERIKVSGAEITEQDVVTLTNTVREAASGLSPTFFEVVTAMAFLHFRQCGVQWAVVETGLGGRLDSTNVLIPEVCVITPISMDHQDFLGNTLPEVAVEKAGIIKDSVPLVSAPQQAEALEVIRKTAQAKGSKLYFAGEDFSHKIEEAAPGHVRLTYKDTDLEIPGIKIPLSGEYQATNASVAVQTFSLALNRTIPLEPEENLARATGSVRDGARGLVWHGRLELVAQDPAVYIDGAHNPAATAALAHELLTHPIAAQEDLVLVLGVMKDKDMKGLITPLLGLAGEIICTAPAYGRAATPVELAAMITEMGYKAEAVTGVDKAMDSARAKGRTVLVTGSFYTAGEALEALGSKGVLTRLREC